MAFWTPAIVMQRRLLYGIGVLKPRADFRCQGPRMAEDDPGVAPHTRKECAGSHELQCRQKRGC